MKKNLGNMLAVPLLGGAIALSGCANIKGLHNLVRNNNPQMTTSLQIVRGINQDSELLSTLGVKNVNLDQITCYNNSREDFRKGCYIVVENNGRTFDPNAIPSFLINDTPVYLPTPTNMSDQYRIK